MAKDGGGKSNTRDEEECITLSGPLRSAERSTCRIRLRADPAERVTLYLPALSQLSVANFDLKIRVELPLSTTKPFKGAPFVFFGGRRAYMVVSRKTRPTFWRKCMKENVETKWSPFEAVGERYANHGVKKIGKKMIIWAVKSGFRVPHRNILTLYCG